MVRFPEGSECAAIRDMAERYSIQHPKAGDFDALEQFQVTIPAASKATLTFPVRSGYEIIIPKIIIDFFTSTNYSIIVRGQKFEGDNEAIFHVPQKVSEVNGKGDVVIVIENLSALSVTYSGRIEGWARSLGT